MGEDIMCDLYWEQQFEIAEPYSYEPEPDPYGWDYTEEYPF